MYTPETIPTDSTATVYIRFSMYEYSQPEEIEQLIGQTFIFDYPAVGTQTGLSTLRTAVNFDNESAKILEFNRDEGYAIVKLILPNAFDQIHYVTGISFWPVMVWEDERFHEVPVEGETPGFGFDGRSQLPGWE